MGHTLFKTVNRRNYMQKYAICIRERERNEAAPGVQCIMVCKTNGGERVAVRVAGLSIPDVSAYDLIVSLRQVPQLNIII